jgi:hypothetical protein
MLKIQLAFTASLLLVGFLGAGCRAQAPLQAAPGSAMRALAAQMTQKNSPETAAELRLPLTAMGFVRLQTAVDWQPKSPRVDFYYDLWDGESFRKTRDAQAPKLRVKLKEKKASWQVSSVQSRRTVQQAGLPVGVVVAQSWDGKLPPEAGADLLKQTRVFFDRLDQGGQPLRQTGMAVDSAWRRLNWEGAQPYALPDVSVAQIFPSATKRRQGWTLTLPGDDASLGLTLFLNRDESRDEAGRWRERFEIEAEPLRAVGPAEELDRMAQKWAHWLSEAGLRPQDVAPEIGDGALFTAKQLVANGPRRPR